MVSQGDITLLQRITQPKIGLWLCWPSLWGEEGYCSPLHTALELGLLSGENRAFEPTQAWQGVSC